MNPFAFFKLLQMADALGKGNISPIGLAKGLKGFTKSDATDTVNGNESDGLSGLFGAGITLPKPDEYSGLMSETSDIIRQLGEIESPTYKTPNVKYGALESKILPYGALAGGILGLIGGGGRRAVNDAMGIYNMGEGIKSGKKAEAEKNAMMEYEQLVNAAKSKESLLSKKLYGIQLKSQLFAGNEGRGIKEVADAARIAIKRNHCRNEG
jgi:hypothetical protein